MKTLSSILLLAVLAAVPAHAQKGNWVFPKPEPAPPLPPVSYEPVPIYQNNMPPAISPPLAMSPRSYVYQQRLMVAGHSALISQEQGQAIIDRFKAAYLKLGSPRLLIFVNRELVADKAGVRLVPAGTPPTLADRQTARDVERLFCRPLRAAGAVVADDKLAAQLGGESSATDSTNAAAAAPMPQDRDTLLQSADAAVEILMASKNLDESALSGSVTVTVPDVQVTMINLKDGKILGQASSAEATGHVPYADLGSYNVSEVTEATAFALMDDMAPLAK
jgi:hypothetical protein